MALEIDSISTIGTKNMKNYSATPEVNLVRHVTHVKNNAAHQPFYPRQRIAYPNWISNPLVHNSQTHGINIIVVGIRHQIRLQGY